MGARMLADIFVPGGTTAERDAWSDFQRSAADPEAAAKLYELIYSYDATRAAKHVTNPSLVLHRRGDAAVSFDLGRELAASLPAARFVPLDGTRHLPWQGDVEPVLTEVLAFLREHGGAAADAPAGPPGRAPVGTGPEEAHTAPAMVGPISLPELSAREMEVLRLVADGLSDREIAERLVLSPHTVHRHVANIRNKLRQPSRAAAAAHAARLGLI
jgi:DNA-binding CsgD family transcriptional regulator